MCLNQLSRNLEENVGKVSWLLANFYKNLEENLGKASWLLAQFDKNLEENADKKVSWLLALTRI